MRSLIVSFFLMLFTASAGAQDFYYVTVIPGMIRKQDRTELKIGDKLLVNDKLLFANKDCCLLLLHPQKGRFELEPDKTQSTPSGEFFLFLKTNLHLQMQTMKLSSRVDIGIDDFFSVKSSADDILLFIGNTKFDLHQSGYLQSDTVNNFFFLQYNGADGKVYKNRLSIIHDSLNINESSFFLKEQVPQAIGK